MLPMVELLIFLDHDLNLHARLSKKGCDDL
jgi:hypothetical protein